MHSAGVRIGLRLWQIDVVYHYVHTDAFFARRNIVYQSSRLDEQSPRWGFLCSISLCQSFPLMEIYVFTIEYRLTFSTPDPLPPECKPAIRVCPKYRPNQTTQHPVYPR